MSTLIIFRTRFFHRTFIIIPNAYAFDGWMENVASYRYGIELEFFSIDAVAIIPNKCDANYEILFDISKMLIFIYSKIKSLLDISLVKIFNYFEKEA